MQNLKTQGLSPSGAGVVSVRSLKGVGPKTERILREAGIETVGDLLRWYPRRHEKRYPVERLSELTLSEEKRCVEAKIAGASVVRYGGMVVFRALLQDGPRSLYAVFFRQPYLKDVFVAGKTAVLYGRPERKGRHWQMIHPEYEIFDGPAKESPHHGRWVPVYPLTKDLGQKWLRQTVHQAILHYAGAVVDLHAAALKKRLGLVDLSRALAGIHFPASEEDRLAAYRRLVFDEFYALQRTILRQRKLRRTHRPDLSGKGAGLDEEVFLGSLPFALTAAQSSALSDIRKDLSSHRTMDRLLQGDVGSGKTVVACAAAYRMAMTGFQTAVMAPTMVLARQLFCQFSAFLEPHGICVGFISGSDDPRERARIEADVSGGSLRVVIGTHALLSKEVRFQRLGLVVIDEEHKFGSAQKEAMRKKDSRGVHCLSMSATPIPKSLAQTLYGDREVSRMTQKPSGRSSVRTFHFLQQDRTHVERWLEGLMGEGARIFVVCPRIDPREDGEGACAVAVHESLSRRFPKRRIGLLHGRMKEAQKRSAMEGLRSGKIELLVSTVVIEVGVDIPKARCMVIESADRFGLAQLHQLRGRVGRGEGESVCILFSDSESEETDRRLELFASTESGFEIAEKDLLLRGEGDVRDHRQHGLMTFEIGDAVRDADLMRLAREEAVRAEGGES